MENLKETILFKELIASSKGIKEKRAELAAKSIIEAQEALIRELDAKKTRTEIELEYLLDLNPQSTTSLKVVSKDFDADKFIKDTGS